KFDRLDKLTNAFHALKTKSGAYDTADGHQFFPFKRYGKLRSYRQVVNEVDNDIWVPTFALSTLFLNNLNSPKFIARCVELCIKQQGIEASRKYITAFIVYAPKVPPNYVFADQGGEGLRVVWCRTSSQTDFFKAAPT
ncbi:unnamed protein product, partial [Ilex paraguariensis]